MSGQEEQKSVRYAASGVVAHGRLSPLLPSDWIDVTTTSTTRRATSDNSSVVVPDFLWENAPRRESKDYRDTVKVYSHLPNGTTLLDSKWALGRLFEDAHEQQQEESSDPLLATLETHCFRGLDGFESFGRKLKLFEDEINSDTDKQTSVASYPDIMDDETMDLSSAPTSDEGPSNLWVIKDAMANGAGGIWVVGPENATSFGHPDTTPLYPEHRYVAQRYVWPPVLFGGRKCHVRLYSLLTSDGRAFIHPRAFLHVANDKFTTNDASQSGAFQDSIHITNCCTNSHDDSKFAGEILADLEATDLCERDGQSVVPLAAFFPSIRACISHYAQRAFPLLQGGHANHGFEYMGVDFMLSHRDGQPVAYMLEINAPPSQDTATGLPHAENLHNEVIRDLTTLWVLPHVTHAPEHPGGWRCVYTDEHTAAAAANVDGELIVPSKAAIINKIRWSLFEKKALRKEKEQEDARTTATASASASVTVHSKGQTEQGTIQEAASLDSIRAIDVATFARSQFPYFTDAVHCQHTTHPQVFFESAGGSQVVQPVIDAVSDSLRYRHRSQVGSKTKEGARRNLRTILGAEEDAAVFLGPNATTLLSTLADKYVQCGLLGEHDEIVVSTENHVANYDPWVRASKESGATLKFWTPFRKRASTIDGYESSFRLEDLVTPNTRILAVPHASNVLGQIRDIRKLSKMVKQQSDGHTHIIVDGVAAVPHYAAGFGEIDVDWYVVSCHKLFGPHVGALCASRRAVERLSAAAATSSSASDDSLYRLMEGGTINYEGCAGVIGLCQYFASLSSFSPGSNSGNDAAEEAVACMSKPGEECMERASTPLSRLEHLLQTRTTKEQMQTAYARIRLVEEQLVDALLQGLNSSSTSVHILQGDENDLSCLARLPIISFIHDTIAPPKIVSACEKNGIGCRYSSFLCSHHLAEDFDFDHSEGVVRVSLAHYNTVAEVESLLNTLRKIPKWQ